MEVESQHTPAEILADRVGVAIDHERLSELLGRPELQWLIDRLRRRFESTGAAGGPLRLGKPTQAQRATIERLMGRRLDGTAIVVDAVELERLLREAGIAADLRQAVEALTGPVLDRRALEAHEADAWSVLMADGARTLSERCIPSSLDPLQAWLADLEARGTVRRIVHGDLERGRSLLGQAVTVACRLPAAGIPLAELAATATGDSHALDADRSLAALVLRAAMRITGMKKPHQAAERRELWARVGVLCDELSAPAIVLNLPATGSSLTARVLRAHAESGEPCHISLRQLVRERPTFDVTQNAAVFICENPSVVAAAAARLGRRSAPLVCTSGQPSTTVTLVLDALVAAGAQLLYHGDFDWGGIRIGNLVMRRHGARPWRFCSTDYRAAQRGSALRGDRVAATWDTDLENAMLERALAVHEEALLDELVADLEQR